jgi:DNA-binding CsgD family transcriptional regulator
MVGFLQRRGRPPCPDILTPSEWRVLDLVREGRTNTEIALDLGITVHGVKYHISNMLGKLYLQDRHQLASWEAPRESSPHRVSRLRGLIPSLALPKVASVLATGVLLAAVGGGAVAFALMVRSASKGPDAADVNAGQAGFRIDSVTTSDLGTVVKFTVPLSKPFDSGYVPLGLDQITLPPEAVAREAFPSGRQIRVEPSASNGSVAITYMTGPLPPDSTAVTVDVAKISIDGHPEGPWHATFPVVPTQSRDLTGRVPHSIETEYGWSYVIDSVRADDTAVAISYHREGPAEVLAQLQPASLVSQSAAAGATVRGATATSTGATVVIDRPAGNMPVQISLPGAVVRSDKTVTAKFTLTADSWQPTEVAIGGVPAHAKLLLGTASTTLGPVPTPGGGGAQFSIEVDSPNVTLSPGAGITANPTLVDDLGTSYVLFGGQANDGSTSGQASGFLWNFRGTIDPKATQLTFSFPDLPDMQTGDWTLTIPFD